MAGCGSCNTRWQYTDRELRDDNAGVNWGRVARNTAAVTDSFTPGSIPANASICAGDEKLEISPYSA